MAGNSETSLLPIEDYEAIEAAVKETVRGRWFLEEFARRNRNADTLAVVAQIEKLEKSMKAERAVPDIDRIRLDLADMAEAIVRTKHEIASIKHESEDGNRFQQASNELDAIVSQTEGATNDILLNAEKIQEIAWTLREAKAPDELCDAIEAASTEIYMACSFQDLTGQRTRKVVTVLRYLESRINAMMTIWGFEGLVDSGLPMDMPPQPDGEDTRPDAHLLNGPALAGQGMDQDSIDDLLVDHDARVSQSEADDMFDSIVIEPDEFDAAVDKALKEPAPEEARSDAIAESDVLADDLDMIGAADAGPGEAAPDVFASAPAVSATPSGPVATAAAEEIDFYEADVFAPPARPQAPVATPAAPARVVQRVGNTLQEVEVEAALAAPSPALAVVPNDDPIAALTPEQRLTTFG